MKKVVVTDHLFPDLTLERQLIESQGIELVERQCKGQPELLKQAVQGADYIINQFAIIDAPVIACMDKAQIIVRYGIGVDNIDLDAAAKAGIPVCNVPEFCIEEVADHTLALILAATRQVVAHANSIRNGEWKLVTPTGSFTTLSEQTVGVIGFGRIGRAVVQRLKGFGTKILIFDPAATQESIAAAGAIAASSVADVLKASDIVTLHCPSLPSTRRIINADSLAVAKPGMTLINVGRGDLVDSTALVDALDSGRVGMAMLDVCDVEPVPLDHPFRKLPQVVMSPHIASVSTNAMQRLRETVARHVIRAHKGDPLIHVVNGVTR